MPNVQQHTYADRSLIVDKDITEAKGLENVYADISSAINAARSMHREAMAAGSAADTLPELKIKIASDLYEVNLYIDVPGLILEPKEKGGEVTLQQDGRACVIIDVGAGNCVTITNTRMLFEGKEDARPTQKMGG